MPDPAEKEVYRLLKESGARRMKSRRHEKWHVPGVGLVVLPRTPSDRRSWRNALAFLRRRFRAAGPQYRPNPDPRTQELDRRAASGDLQAAREALFARYRSGTLTLGWLQAVPAARQFLPELPLAFFASAHPSFLAALPPAVDSGIWENTAVARFVPNMSPFEPLFGDKGGWFPHHEQANVCPRGHVFGARAPSDHPAFSIRFEYMEVEASSRQVEDAEPGYLGLGSYDSGGGEFTYVSCGECWAAWPVDPTWEVEFV